MSTRILFTGALLAAAMVSAQEPAPPAPSAVPEPEYEGVVVYVDPKTGALAGLERVEALRQERAVSGGYRMVERYLELPGAKSAVRFARNERPVLVVRVPSRTRDPYNLFSLVAFQTRGKTRVLTLENVQLLLGKVEPLPLPKVPLKIEKYGDSSFELRPVQLRRPGEYCVLMSELTRFLFCFGAD